MKNRLFQDIIVVVSVIVIVWFIEIKTFSNLIIPEIFGVAIKDIALVLIGYFYFRSKEK